MRGGLLDIVTNPYFGDLVLILLRLLAGGVMGYGIAKTVERVRSDARQAPPIRTVCVAGAFTCFAAYELAMSVWVQGDLLGSCVVCGGAPLLMTSVRTVREWPLTAALMASALASSIVLALWLGARAAIKRDE